jgi:tetratricopeptide (TPR) repeat protein
MRAYVLSISLLAVLAFSLAATLEPWFQNWAGSRTQSDNLLQVALGDSRRLFARHFFTQADVYFHNGYYPGIYDNKEGFEKTHLGSRQAGETEEEENFLGKPKDWLDRFGRNFFPSRHTHLSDSSCGRSCCQRAREGKGHDDNCAHKGHVAGQHENETSPAGLEREILPWLRLSAEMDPQRVETYVVASFWLRNKLGQVDEAEQFLREGLQANPGDCEILLELGRIQHENRKQPLRARNMLELALVKCREQESHKPEPDVLLLGEILNQLASLEREQNNYPKAIQYYTALKEVSPNKDAVQAWIDYLQTNGPPIIAPFKVSK